MSEKTLSDKIWEDYAEMGNDVVVKEDVKGFLAECERIITRRCLGTSANCYEIKKEIRTKAGDKFK